MPNESGLCYKCQNKFYTAVVDTCTNCGATTACGGFKLCPKCAKKKNKCAFCGGQLDAIKPPTPPDARLVWLVSLNHDGRQPTEGREAILAKTGEAVDTFKSSLADLLAQQHQPAAAIEILNEMRALGIVVIRCTTSLATAVGKMQGVHAVAENE